MLEIRDESVFDGSFLIKNISPFALAAHPGGRDLRSFFHGHADDLRLRIGFVGDNGGIHSERDHAKAAELMAPQFKERERKKEFIPPDARPIRKDREIVLSDQLAQRGCVLGFYRLPA